MSKIKTALLAIKDLLDLPVIAKSGDRVVGIGGDLDKYSVKKITSILNNAKELGSPKTDVAKLQQILAIKKNDLKQKRSRKMVSKFSGLSQKKLDNMQSIREDNPFIGYNPDIKYTKGGIKKKKKIAKSKTKKLLFGFKK